MGPARVEPDQFHDTTVAYVAVHDPHQGPADSARVSPEPISAGVAGRILGFTVSRGASVQALSSARSAQARVLAPFGRFATRSLTVGPTILDVWGVGLLDTCVQPTREGSWLVLVGAPQPPASLADLPPAFVEGDGSSLEALPWEGRVVLLRLSADGHRWTLCNDWLGAIPVFCAEGPAGRVASTLEPAVVAAMGYTPDDIHLPALLCLLINGHLLSDWTFYRGMRTMPPDSVIDWDATCRTRALHTVVPTAERWEAPWNDLVDEHHALATDAVVAALSSQPAHMLLLSGGLDSRLIACIGHRLGANLEAYVWGASDTVDAVCSRAVARQLGLPWRRVDLGVNYLTTYTRRWAEWFGSAVHFHGMYQMAFYDAVADVDGLPVVSGFLNDVLNGTAARNAIDPLRGRLYDDWYTHWTIDELRGFLRISVDDALAELAGTIEAQLANAPGARYQRAMALEIWHRCRLFTGFQVTLADYWRGVTTPFMNRAYARFCLSLPMAAVDDRRLLHDVMCRFYPAVAAIPGTHAPEPLLRTGRYLVLRRLADVLPLTWRRGPLGVFRAVDPRMDCDALRAAGPPGLWPIRQAERQLAAWLDVEQLQSLYHRATSESRDYRALRRLQSVQTLAYRLLDSAGND